MDGLPALLGIESGGSEQPRSLLRGLPLVVGPCSATSAGPPRAGRPAAAPVGPFKRYCDKMKFFDCSSAEEQARRYSDCDKATPSQVEFFSGCAGSSICDPACRTSITPASQPKEGGGGSSSTCTSACEKLISCSFIAI